MKEPAESRRTRRLKVIADILVALLITIVAIVLGITVHPLLFFLLVLAVVWLFARHGTRRGARI